MWLREHELMRRSMANRRFKILAAMVCILGVGVFVALINQLESPTPANEQLKALSLRAYQGDRTAIGLMKGTGTNALPQLVRLLRTHDSVIRKGLWAGLRQAPAKARQKVATQFPPPSAEAVREAAARALGLLGEAGKPAISALADALRDTEGRVRVEAAAALVRIGTNSVPALIGALKDKDAKARQTSAGALGEIGMNNSNVLTALSRSLNDPDPWVRYSAAYSLACLGTTGVLVLINNVRHPVSESAKTSAANMLTNSYGPVQRAAAEFYQSAKGGETDTRRLAVESIGYLPSQRDIAVIVVFESLKDRSPGVRLAAVGTLEKIGRKEPELLTALAACLKDESPQVRDAAAALMRAWETTE